VDVYTIGFTRKSAAEFFGLLRGAGIRRLIDVRLNNVSQLAGFSKRDDLAFFYHSGGAEPGIHGIVEITREGYPDHTALDPKDPHYDPRSKSGESQWSMVDIRAVERLSRPVTLSEMRTNPELEGMPLLKKGNRLSVQKVGAAEWNAVLRLAKQTTG
jgi:predicted RNA-binding protein with PUA-like domain